MGPEYGPLPSLKGSDVGALGLYSRIHKGYIRGPLFKGPYVGTLKLPCKKQKRRRKAHVWLEIHRACDADARRVAVWRSEFGVQGLSVLRPLKALDPIPRDSKSALSIKEYTLSHIRVPIRI